MDLVTRTRTRLANHLLSEDHPRGDVADFAELYRCRYPIKKKITALFGIDEDRWDDPPISPRLYAKNAKLAISAASALRRACRPERGMWNAMARNVGWMIPTFFGSRIADMSRHIIPSGND